MSQNFVLLFSGTLYAENISKNEFIIFGLSVEKFESLRGQFFGRIVKVHSTCPVLKFEEVFRKKIVKISVFWTLSYIFKDFWQKLSNKAVKLQSTCPKEHFEDSFLGKVFKFCLFLAFELKIFGIFPKNVRQGCQPICTGKRH